MNLSNRIIEFQGATVKYTVSGNGPAIMLVHGFGEDSHIWMNQAGKISAKYRLILPDLPGSGESEMIKQAGTGMETFAECLRAILENENIQKCVMIGHSMGGYITLALAEKYPEVLRGFGLLHSTALADNDEKIQTRKKGIDFMEKFGAPEFLKTSIPGLFRDPTKNKEDIAELLRRSARFSTEALCQYYEAMIRRPDRRHVISRARVPFWLAAGAFDKAVPLEQSLQQAYISENTEIHILRESGHMGMLEESKKCSDIIDSFLANPCLS